MRGGRRGARSEGGFALLLVLWSLVLLTLITTRLVAGGRSEVQLAGNLRAAAAAEMLADAAVHEAMFRFLQRGSTGWVADGVARPLRLPGGAALVRIEDEAGRVSPNQAPEALLGALLRAVGADAGTARSVAAAMVDWRSMSVQSRPFGAKAAEYRAAGKDYAPPQAPFRSVEEVGLVLGMTPELLRRVSPYLTVFYDGDPDPALAAPVVLAALRAATGQAELGAGAQQGARTLDVRATAEADGGGRFVRRAVVRVGAAGGVRPYQVLDWRRVSGGEG